MLNGLQRAASERLVPLLLDVTNADQIAAAAQTVAEHVGSHGLDALINNAGIALAMPLELVPVDQFRYQLEVNVVGVLTVTQAFIPLLRQARGRVINISSVAGRIAGSLQAHTMLPNLPLKHLLIPYARN